MARFASPTRRNDGDMNHLTNGGNKLAIKSLLNTVAIHGIEKNFPDA